MSLKINNQQAFTTVTVSAGIYTVLLGAVRRQSGSTAQLRESIKVVSALHASWMSIATLFALNRSWATTNGGKVTASTKGPSDYYPEDSRNPMISGYSSFGNFLTAVEAGYLTYDTGALIAEVYLRAGKPSLHTTVRQLAGESPAFFAHHVGIASALLYLQTYIRRGHEKGVWVILALFLMNASTPFMHVRWLMKKRRGTVPPSFDVLFAAVFAASRFGVVAWILKKYASHHQLGPIEVLRKLRAPCQTGTGLLVGLNAIWWLFFVKGIYRRCLRR